MERLFYYFWVITKEDPELVSLVTFITFTILLGFNLYQECFRAKGQGPILALGWGGGVTG